MYICAICQVHQLYAKSPNLRIPEVRVKALRLLSAHRCYYILVWLNQCHLLLSLLLNLYYNSWNGYRTFSRENVFSVIFTKLSNIFRFLDKTFSSRSIITYVENKIEFIRISIYCKSYHLCNLVFSLSRTQNRRWLIICLDQNETASFSLFLWLIGALSHDDSRIAIHVVNSN